MTKWILYNLKSCTNEKANLSVTLLLLSVAWKTPTKDPNVSGPLKEKKNSEMTVTCGVCPSVHGEVHQVIFVQE